MSLIFFTGLFSGYVKIFLHLEDQKKHNKFVRIRDAEMQRCREDQETCTIWPYPLFKSQKGKFLSIQFFQFINKKRSTIRNANSALVLFWRKENYFFLF